MLFNVLVNLCDPDWKPTEVISTHRAPPSPIATADFWNNVTMRMVRKILAGAGLLLVVLVAGLVIAVSTIDVNVLLGPVRSSVKAATGRELTVNGGASITLSLAPKLLLEEVALSNAPWGAAPQLLTAKRLEIEVKLLPLLSRRVELGRVELADLALYLEVDGTGRKNWLPDRAAVAEPAQGENGREASLPVDTLVITNGTLSFRDGGTARTIAAIDRLSLHARDASSPMAAEFRGRAAGIAVSVEGTLGTLRDLLQGNEAYPVRIKGNVAGKGAAIKARIRIDGRQVTLDDLDLNLGANAMSGRLSVTIGEPRSRVTFDLAGPALAVKDIPFPLATAASAPASSVASGGAASWLIPDTPVDFAPLRTVDVAGTLTLARLQLADGRQFDDLHAVARLDAGRLDVPGFKVAFLGGTLAGNFKVDASRAGHEALAVRFRGDGLDLSAILSAIGKPRELRGGRTDIDVDLTMRGASPRAWASSASGNVRIAVGPATLVNAGLDFTSGPGRVVRAVDPFHESDPSTEYICAVARLTLTDGVARSERPMATESRKLDVSASGTLDLRDETLDLTFNRKMHKGFSIGVVPNLADLVRVRGPIASPQISLYAAGSAKAIAKAGAAAGTAGLSIAGRALAGRVEAGSATPCAIAQGSMSGQSGKQDSPPRKDAASGGRGRSAR